LRVAGGSQCCSGELKGRVVGDVQTPVCREARESTVGEVAINDGEQVADLAGACCVAGDLVKLKRLGITKHACVEV
jgi:hypothetical protein